MQLVPKFYFSPKRQILYVPQHHFVENYSGGPGETPTKFIIIPLLRAQSLHRNNSEAVEEKTREGVKRRSPDTPQEQVDLQPKN